MPVHRDSKGRFCRPDTQTPELFPKVGDTMFHHSMVFEGGKPHHYSVKAYEVEEVLPGGGWGAYVCFPWTHRPDEPMHLERFLPAKNKALDETTNIQMAMNADMLNDYHLLASDAKRDKLAFNKPANFDAPKFNMGEKVWCVVVLSTIALQISACKGVIIGAMFHYEDSTRISNLRPGWNYQIYHQRFATEHDRYYGDTPGEVLENYTWVHETEIYRDRDLALKEFLKQARNLNSSYAQIFKDLENLTPEDVLPKD